MITRAEIGLWLRALLRWWWIIVVSVVLASGTAFVLVRGEPRVYQAGATLMIGNTLESQAPDQNQISVSVALARYYGELAQREPILKPVQESLKLPFSWQVLGVQMLATNVVPNANLLEIHVTDSNPVRAAAIANAVGDQLIAFSPASPDKIQAQQQAVDQQLNTSDSKIKQIQQDIAETTAQQDHATSASDLSEINQKLVQLNASLNQEQETYQSLLQFKTSSVANSLSFFERAVAPTTPVPSKSKIVIAGAALAGMLLALLAIVVIELLDPRMRGPRDVEAQLQMPDLGHVPSGPPMFAAETEFVTVRLGAAREAQTNIMLAAADRGMRTLMITSPQSSEARAAFSLDLADLFAQSGHKVLLVDADAASSFITQILMPDGVPSAQNVLSATERSNIWSFLYPTLLPNVALLPGRWTSNGAPVMLPSLRWQQLVNFLHDTADVIIFDGPAALNGPDAALLAPHLDGVVLVLDPDMNSRDEILKSRERLLHQNGSRLLGSVTLTPTKQKFQISAMLQQLRGRELPLTLPAPAEIDVDEMPDVDEVHEPLITPVPDDFVETIEVSKPLITPAPIEVESAEFEDAIELGRSPAPDRSGLPSDGRRRRAKKNDRLT